MFFSLSNSALLIDGLDYIYLAGYVVSFIWATYSLVDIQDLSFCYGVLM